MKMSEENRKVIEVEAAVFKAIWNEAIEAAARKAEFEGCFVGTVEKLRSLKK